MRADNDQRGAALLIVLMLVATMAASAMVLTRTMNRSFQFARVAAAQDAAIWAALGAEEAALVILDAQARARPGIDTPEERWLASPLTLPTDGGVLTASFRDLSGCFNVNQLVTEAGEGAITGDPVGLDRFEAWIVAKGGDANAGRLLAAMATDFMDDNDRQEIGGAEDLAYDVGDAPYVTAAGKLVDVSELRAIKGWSAENLLALSGELCTRPGDAGFGLVNLNTLMPEDAPLLHVALDERVTVLDLEKLLDRRPPDGFANVGSFTASPVFEGLEPPLQPDVTGRLATYASYIEFKVTVVYGTGSVELTSLIESIGGQSYRVVSRRFGGDDA